MEKQLAVVCFSGGMDSTALAYKIARRDGFDLHLVSFDYGQRHAKEIEYAMLTAEQLQAKHSVIDLKGVGSFLSGSALTSDIEVPEGHYADETMKLTVVPNRNAIMLSICFGIAVAENARIVATAVHAGDHFIYPDCRPEFIHLFRRMQQAACEGFGNPDLSLDAPFVKLTKRDIAMIGESAGVPWDETWSCYKGGELHCGKCGTCVERREAFDQAGVVDPTEYEDESE